ncbi:MAG: cupin domain-containing protein, partial [Planctomycetaceae bacterium]|nr:cupin domain-containing protein [Planctomycetaceae bacterium]
TCLYAVDFANDAPHLWHYHLQDELIVVTRGRIQQQIGPAPGSVAYDEILTTGDAVYLPAQSWHTARPLDADTQVMFTIKGGDGVYRAYEADGQELTGAAD